MSSAQTKITPAGSNDPAVLVAVDRATAELRRGGPVVLHDLTARVWLVVAAETAEDESVGRLRAMGEGDPHLVLTAERATALGPRTAEREGRLFPVAGQVAGRRSLAPGGSHGPRLASAPAGLTGSEVPADVAMAVVELAKLARLLPAAIVAPLRLQSATHAADWARSRDLLDVSVGAIDSYQLAAARGLRIVSEARVPWRARRIRG